MSITLTLPLDSHEAKLLMSCMKPMARNHAVKFATHLRVHLNWQYDTEDYRLEQHYVEILTAHPLGGYSAVRLTRINDVPYIQRPDDSAERIAKVRAQYAQFLKSS